MTEPDRQPRAASLAGPFELESGTLGALPLIDHFLARMDVAGMLARHLPASAPRTTLAAASVVGVLVRNLCVEREPLYGLAGWAGRFEPEPLGLEAGQAGLLNDDRIGRALDELFDADRGSLLCALVLHAIREFNVDCEELHNDSTSIVLHGNYSGADGRERAGKPTVIAARGHSKDHRPDLKQLVLILTVTADGAVPLRHRLAAGNTNDEQTHIQTWDELHALTGRAGFLYVADCKLCTREQMQHIDAHGGRFVTILPRSRKEDRVLRDWMHTDQPDWTEADRRPSRRGLDPDEVYSTTPAPIRSTEGYRIVWTHSTHKLRLDQQARHDQLDRASAALAELNTRLAGSHCRFHDSATVKTAADQALAKRNCTQLLNVTISERTEQRIRYESRGANRKPRQRKTTRQRFTIAWEIDQQALARDHAADGCFPLITNDHQLTDAEILRAYRYQPNLEKRHHQLKTVQHAAPVTLKSPSRIEALFCCQFIALLCSCLIERELRTAMANAHITELPLYPEHRPCTAPTATRVFDHLAPLQRHHLTHNQHRLQPFQPQLTPLQTHLLDLLNVPATAYTNNG
jgi:transposase